MNETLRASTGCKIASAAVRQAATPTLWRSVRRLVDSLSRRRHGQLVGLLGLSVIGALAELGTIGAVLPFLALMAEPSLASRYALLRSVFTFLGWGADKDIFLPVTALFVVMALAVGAIRTLLTWVVYRFSYGVGADLGKEIYRRTLRQPYAYHVARNSSETLASLTKVQHVVGGVINPLMQSAVAVLFVAAIAVALLIANAGVLILTALAFAGVYWLITATTRTELNRQSAVVAEMETRRVQAVQEGLGGIRDVILDGTQGVFVDRYWIAESRERRAQAASAFMSFAPRYVIESLGMIAIAVLAFVMSTRDSGAAGALPSLGALALGAQRALPQIQLVYFGWASISANRASLDDVVSVLELPIVDAAPIAAADRLRIERSIELDNVSFRYSADGPEVLSQINLKIERGARVGIAGKTGSGKSTLVDLIMGLLEPTGGEIRIDGRRLAEANRRRWQAAIAHVPQAIFLADATIAENIAFGQEPRSIDRARVAEAVDRAAMAGFVKSSPKQLNAVVGERGVRLSGGQRQRIGLARAFYKGADVIVLDEATSALDNATEAAVMDAVYATSRDVTVLIIAHRLTTLRTCDRIIELDGGRIVRECRYEDLVAPTAEAAR